MKLIDSFQRPITYLRISVTDRCNLRCIYCMPPEGVPSIPHGEVLRYEEILRIVEAAASLGISKLRLSGGEPLVRPGTVDLVAMLSQVPGIEEVSMTTNAMLLDRYAAALKHVGLQRVNISLDSLRPERFWAITRYGDLDKVLSGIAAAQAAGLSPVKINVVLMSGINDDEILDFARKSRDEGWHVRFIEPMPLGYEASCAGGSMWSGGYLPAAEVMERIEALGPLEPCEAEMGNGPARYFRLPGAQGTIGFITPISEHFCDTCNRLRLTADGKLLMCLLADLALDLKAPLRQGASLEDLRGLFCQAAAMKPQGHQLLAGVTATERHMVQIGG